MTAQMAVFKSVLTANSNDRRPHSAPARLRFGRCCCCCCAAPRHRCARWSCRTRPGPPRGRHPLRHRPRRCGHSGRRRPRTSRTHTTRTRHRRRRRVDLDDSLHAALSRRLALRGQRHHLRWTQDAASASAIRCRQRQRRFSKHACVPGGAEHAAQCVYTQCYRAAPCRTSTKK